jgi:hypothetical protein
MVCFFEYVLLTVVDFHLHWIGASLVRGGRKQKDNSGVLRMYPS